MAGPGAVRYAMPRDENSPPAVVAPPLGGVLFRVSNQKRPPRNRRPLFVARPPPGPETRGATVDAQRTEMTTRDGVRITRTAAPFDPAELGRIAALADERRGGVMSSGMEYPGRYSRWHMAYADPCAGDRRHRQAGDGPGAERPGPRAAAGDPRRPAPGRAHDPARRRGHRRRRRGRPGVHRGGAQPQADRVHRAAGDHRGVRLRGPAPGPVRGVRLRPGVPVRAGAAAARPPGHPA